MTSIEREKPGTPSSPAQSPAARPRANQAAITHMSYGRGAVVAILGEGLWRWSLLKPDTQDLRGFYDTFWSNLIRWLALGGDFAPGEQVSLQLSRSTSRWETTSRSTSRRSSPADGASPTLNLVASDGTALNVALHKLPGVLPRYRAHALPAVAGVHQVACALGMTPGELAKQFNVYNINLERLHTAANLQALQLLAEQSGGKFLDESAVDDLESLLERHLASLEMPSATGIRLGQAGSHRGSSAGWDWSGSSAARRDLVS